MNIASSFSSLPRLLLFAALLSGCGESNPIAPTDPTNYFLVTIDGAPASSDLLYFYSDGRFGGTGGGTYIIKGSEITLSFNCPDRVAACLSSWRGTFTGKTPPEASTIDLREDNGAGRLRHYQRGFEL